MIFLLEKLSIGRGAEPAKSNMVLSLGIRQRAGEQRIYGNMANDRSRMSSNIFVLRTLAGHH